MCNYESNLNNMDIFFCLITNNLIGKFSVCKSNPNIYISSTYNSENVLNSESNELLFNLNTVNYLLYDYFNYKEKGIYYGEFEYTALVFIEFARKILLLDDYYDRRLSLYNNSVLTTCGEIKFTQYNSLSKTVYLRSFYDNHPIIQYDTYSITEICYIEDIEDYSIYYVDYSKNNEKLIHDTILISIVTQNKISELSEFEITIIDSIKISKNVINNDGGLNGNMIILNTYDYNDLIKNFSNIKSSIFIGIINFDILQSLYPYLSISNKLLIYLLSYEANVCYKNIIFINYNSYDFGFHTSNYLLQKTKSIAIVYEVNYNDYFNSLYSQLINYPFLTINSIPFNIKQTSTFNSISESIKDEEYIILLFGYVFSIEIEIIKLFLPLFDVNQKFVITDLSPYVLPINYRSYLNGFYLFGNYFDSIENIYDEDTKGYLQNMYSSINSYFKDIYTEIYSIDFTIYNSYLSIILIHNLYHITGKKNVDKEYLELINQDITITPYSSIHITKERLTKTRYYIAEYEYDETESNYNIFFYTEFEIYPMNYNPYHNEGKYCNSNFQSKEKDVVKLLYILDGDALQKSINVFIVMNYELDNYFQQDNEDIFLLYSKTFYTLNELKDILKNNQEEYFAYITSINIDLIPEIRYDFNDTILFYITNGYPKSLLQDNIIVTAVIDSCIKELLEEQLELLHIENMAIVSHSNYPIYLFD